MKTPEWLEPHTMAWVCVFIREEIDKEKKWLRKCNTKSGQEAWTSKITILESVHRSLKNRRTRAYNIMINKYKKVS